MRVFGVISHEIAEGIKGSFVELWPWIKFSLTLKAVFLIAVFLIWGCYALGIC